MIIMMSAYILVIAVAADDVLSFSFFFVCCYLFVCCFSFIYFSFVLLLSLSCLDFLLGSAHL